MTTRRSRTSGSSAERRIGIARTSMREAEGHLPALPRQRGEAAQRRPRGDRQVSPARSPSASRRPTRRRSTRASQGAVEAAEPMARLPAYERAGGAPALRRPLPGAVRRAGLCALRRGGQADHAIREGEVDPPDRHLPHRRRGSGADDRRGPAARHLARAPRAIRASGSACRSGRASFISPFNFPLNLAAHKIAPAIAVGCPFVMKPASRTPLGAIIMGEVLAETDSARRAPSRSCPRTARARTCSPPTSG